MNIKEFARTIGVSPTTVSNALSGKGRLSPSTREMVHLKMKELGYSPNATARALVTGRTYRLGIVLNRPEGFGSQDTYFSEILSGILRRATHHDHNLLLHSAHYPDWQALFREICSGSADGVLLIARYTSDELTPAILDSKVPSVCISYSVAHPECYSVDCDNMHGSYLATRHLLKLGHRRLALLYPGDSISWGRERHHGALTALYDLGLSPETLREYEWAETSPPSREWAKSAVNWLKSQKEPPTALICCDERRARMVVELLPEAGVRVPEDVAVISFNSTEISARARPPITSIGQPLAEIGATAVDLLIARIEKREVANRHPRLPMWLDIRGSCGAIVPDPD